jgi:predicted  nucleic acid-binding Zn-ribbon protein
MSTVQLVECVKCGNTVSIPDGSKKMPWEVWPKGCPKCGCSKVDVTVIHDKLGRVKDATIHSWKRGGV